MGHIIHKYFLPFFRFSFQFANSFLCCMKAFNSILLIYFCFYLLFHKGQIQKILLQYMSNSVLPIFLSKSFMVSNLTFKSLIHLSLVLYGTCIILKHDTIQIFINIERINHSTSIRSLAGGSVVKDLPANAGDSGLSPLSGRYPGEGNGYLF